MNIADIVRLGGYYFDINDNYDYYDLSNAFFGESKNSSKSKKTSFMDALYGNMADSTSVFNEIAKVRTEQTRAIVNQLLGKMSAESDARQIALIQTYLGTDKESETSDTQGECLDIASRMILGKAVSPNEILLLSQNYPELYQKAKVNSLYK